MKFRVIAQARRHVAGKGLVMHLGFLEADDIGVMAGLERLQLMGPGTDAINIE